MENAHSSPNEPSNHFRFSREETGHLTDRCIRGRLESMARSERDIYDYCHFLPSQHCKGPWLQLAVDPDWRASIVKWNYNVVDHFNLSREVVSLSMLLFDRFFATRTMPNRDLVLLCSIATINIAIKTKESAVIKLSTLKWFGRERFSENQITCMELSVLFNCKWLVNPPTALAFVMHLLLLWDPPTLSAGGRDSRDSVVLESVDLKMDILESSRFLCELSVTDSFFIARRSSAVGVAAIMNSLEKYELPLPPEVSSGIGICLEDSITDDEILNVRQRLRLLSTANGR